MQGEREDAAVGQDLRELCEEVLRVQAGLERRGGFRRRQNDEVIRLGPRRGRLHGEAAGIGKVDVLAKAVEGLAVRRGEVRAHEFKQLGVERHVIQAHRLIAFEFLEHPLNAAAENKDSPRRRPAVSKTRRGGEGGRALARRQVGLDGKVGIVRPRGRQEAVGVQAVLVAEFAEGQVLVARILGLHELHTWRGEGHPSDERHCPISLPRHPRAKIDRQ